LITGAADDDPSGIASYSQAGAKFGYALSWTLLLTFPLMVVIQAISARLGRVTGRGIAGNLRQYYPNWVLQAIVALLFIANTLNIGADLGAMGAASRLIAPAVPVGIYVVVFGAICVAGQMYFKHTQYVAVLKWLTLALFFYFVSLLMIHVPWPEVLRGLVWPALSPRRDFWLMVVAILGTTISPYLFFWQAAQEVEDTKAASGREPLNKKPEQGRSALERIRVDTVVGMGFSNLVALAIMITAAATLHSRGVTDVTSAAQAAEALRPAGGRFASLLFAAGIIGTGLLSVPVLAGSAAYAVGEARRWPVGLARQPLQAKAFYATIGVAVLLGAAANFSALNPITALIWAAIVNGIVAVPVMALLMLMGANRTIMGQFQLTRPWQFWGWFATALMAVASIAMIASGGM
jgi:NRAMP (natural resistance-associated macrophage protein)-like metal ion transporter